MKRFSGSARSWRCMLITGIGAAVLWACSPAVKSDTADGILSFQQAQEDFFTLLHTIEAGVPHPYNEAAKTSYESAKIMAFNALKDGMTTQDVFRVFYPLVQSLHDAHFAVHLPDDIMEDEKITFFPARVIIDGDRLYVREDLSTGKALKNGSEIYEINGVPSREIIRKISGTEFTRKNYRTFFESRTEAVFHRRLYALWGFSGTFDVKTADTTCVVPGIAGNMLQEPPRPAYEFRMTGRETGYLRIYSLVWTSETQRDSLKNLLEESFHTLKSQSVRQLVIDIRGNLGGSSVLAKDILDYVAPGPYTLSAGVDYFHKGQLHSSVTDSMHTPRAGENAFTGKVVLISDVLTYSSAHMMQVGFQHFNMGITVGQESSESLYITGEIQKTVLRNSRIELIAPTVNFRLPGYVESRTEYYVPDHVVYPSLADRLNGTDVLLNKALDILRENGQ